MPRLNIARIKPAYQGWNAQASPDYLRETQAPVLDNLLCREGKLVMRGPIGRLPNMPSTTDVRGINGWMTCNGVLLIATSATNAAVAGTVMNINTDITGFAVTYGSDNYPGRRSVEYGGAAWGISSEAAKKFLYWPGSSVAPSASANTAAPAGGIDIAVYAQRIFVAGGTLSSGGSHGGPNYVLYTKVGGPTPGAVVAADWTDATSGLVNKILIGDDTTDYIVAMVNVEGGLLILKQRSLWLLTGSGPNSFAVRQITDEKGCLFPGAVTPFGNGCFFLSQSGLVHYDAGNLVDVSQDMPPITVPSSVAIQSRTDPPGAGIGPYAVVARIGPDTILVSTGTVTQTGSATTYSTPTFLATYDAQQRAWSRITSARFTAIPAAWRAGTLNAYGWDGIRVCTFTGYALPEATTVSIGQDGDGNSATMIYTPEVRSRMVRLAMPLQRAALKRLIIDYQYTTWNGSGSGPPAGYGLEVTLLDSVGATIYGPTTLLPDPVDYPLSGVRQRKALDVFAEVDDVQLKLRVVQGSSSSPLVATARIYDAYLEYAVAEDRTG